MKSKIIPIVLCALFYCSMILLTLFSRRIYNNSLPNVKVERLPKKVFSVVFDYTSMGYGYTEGERRSMAIPKEIYDLGKIFIVETGMKNGEERTFVRLLNQVTIGFDDEDNYEVLEGISEKAFVVVNGYEKLNDGDEVYVIKDKR